MITAPIPQSFRFRPIDDEMPNFDNTFDADATARPRMIVPWRQYVPTDGFGVAGYALSIEDDEFWATPNFGTDLYGFRAKGGGVRYGNKGTFEALKIYSFIWTKEEFVWDTLMAYVLGPFAYNYEKCEVSADDKQSGHYLRPVKVLTSLSEGETGTYVGNDGKIYPTRCINGIEWVVENIDETEYRTGDLIPVVTNNATWAALATGARCSYNNDDSNL
jgi:hypothetical protein